MRLVQGGYQIQIKAVATFLVIFSAHMNILFTFKVEILVLIKWYIGPPQIMLNIEPRMVT
jgi:hypothetical protein